MLHERHVNPSAVKFGSGAHLSVLFPVFLLRLTSVVAVWVDARILVSVASLIKGSILIGPV